MSVLSIHYYPSAVEQLEEERPGVQSKFMRDG
jgi:hypothetical protein